jgi:hypothetical protein
VYLHNIEQYIILSKNPLTKQDTALFHKDCSYQAIRSSCRLCIDSPSYFPFDKWVYDEKTNCVHISSVPLKFKFGAKLPDVSSVVGLHLFTKKQNTLHIDKCLTLDEFMHVIKFCFEAKIENRNSQRILNNHIYDVNGFII